MPEATSFAKRPGQRDADLAVIGGGIAGAWLAVLAAREGLRVTLVERAMIGSGASGGLLGALIPHLPDRWNAKKAFQLDALVSLPAEIAELEARTGISCDYRRTGRLVPLRDPHQFALAVERQVAAALNWKAAGFAFDCCENGGEPGWLDPEAAPFGVAFDTLSARLDPAATMAALRALLLDEPRVTVVEHRRAVLQPAGDGIRLDDGTELAAGEIVVTAGWQSFSLLSPVLGRSPASIGGAVKGQAARLAPAAPAGLAARPILHGGGLYVVAHEDGTVAIGSTTERSFAEPVRTDAKLDALIARARALCPALRQANVISRWAGLRPRAVGREPMVGCLPGASRLSVLTGGYKTGFSLTHHLARGLLRALGLASHGPMLPASFSVEARLGEEQTPPGER